MQIGKILSRTTFSFTVLFIAASCQQGSVSPGLESETGSFIEAVDEAQRRPTDQANPHVDEVNHAERPSFEGSTVIDAEKTPMNPNATLEATQTQIGSPVYEATSVRQWPQAARGAGYPFFFLSQREGKNVEGAVAKNIYVSNTGSLEIGKGLSKLHRVTDDLYNPKEHQITDLSISRDNNKLAFLLRAISAGDASAAPKTSKVYLGEWNVEAPHWVVKESEITGEKWTYFASLSWDSSDDKLLVSTFDRELVRHPTNHRYTGWNTTNSHIFSLNPSAELAFSDSLAESSISYTPLGGFGAFSYGGYSIDAVKSSQNQNGGVLFYYAQHEPGRSTSRNLSAKLDDGGVNTVFTSPNNSGEVKSFSPTNDGKELVFVNKDNKIGICNLSDRGQCDNIRWADLKALLPGIQDSYSLCLTGDDKKILFDAMVDSNIDIYMFDRATETVTRLTYAAESDSLPICFKAKHESQVTAAE